MFPELNYPRDSYVYISNKQEKDQLKVMKIKKVKDKAQFKFKYA